MKSLLIKGVHVSRKFLTQLLCQIRVVLFCLMDLDYLSLLPRRAPQDDRNQEATVHLVFISACYAFFCFHNNTNIP